MSVATLQPRVIYFRGNLESTTEPDYDELQKLNRLDNSYDYEVEFVKIWEGLGREVLEKNLGTLSADKRKKKPHDSGMGNNK